MTALTMPTLSTRLWPTTGWPRTLVLLVGASLLLAVSAKLKIPLAFSPVPLTMQTFVVLLLGFVYGPRLAMASVGLYLLEGAFGLPVFAQSPERGLGFAYLLGPTGGYLLGFVLAAGLCGWCAERGWDRSYGRTLLAMLLGNALIYACGLAWLGSVIGFDKPLLAIGLLPFLVGDAVKILLAVALLPSLWRYLSRG